MLCPPLLSPFPPRVHVVSTVSWSVLIRSVWEFCQKIFWLAKKIFVIDQVVWCNHTAEKILGYGREHMIGQDIRDFQTTGAGDSISAKVEITRDHGYIHGWYLKG